MKHHPVILSIAGSDCSGGAGIQADIKAISALGGYAASAITAITVQNTLGVHTVQAMSPEIVRGQIEAVMEDLQPVALKIGMINDIQIVRVISDCIRKYTPQYIVYDPVMVSTSRQKLMTDEAIEEIKKELLPLVTLATPNLDETAVLIGNPIHNIQEMQEAAKLLTEHYHISILVKGGHLEGDLMSDFLYTSESASYIYKEKKIESNNLHGTGCTLSPQLPLIWQKVSLTRIYPPRQTYIPKPFLPKRLHIVMATVRYGIFRTPLHKCVQFVRLYHKIRNFAPAIKNQLNNKNMKAFVFPPSSRSQF